MLKGFFKRLSDTMNEKETDFGEPEREKSQVERYIENMSDKSHKYSDVSYHRPLRKHVKKKDHINILIEIIGKSIEKIGDDYSFSTSSDSWTGIDYIYKWKELDAVIPNGCKYPEIDFTVTMPSRYGKDRDAVTVEFDRPEVSKAWKADFYRMGTMSFVFDADEEQRKRLEDIFALKTINGEKFRAEKSFGGSILDEIAHGVS